MKLIDTTKITNGLFVNIANTNKFIYKNNINASFFTNNINGTYIYYGLIKFKESGNYRIKIYHNYHIKIVVNNNIIYDTIGNNYILNYYTNNNNEYHYCYLNNIKANYYYPIIITIYSDNLDNKLFYISNTKTLNNYLDLNKIFFVHISMLYSGFTYPNTDLNPDLKEITNNIYIIKCVNENDCKNNSGYNIRILSITYTAYSDINIISSITYKKNNYTKSHDFNGKMKTVDVDYSNLNCIINKNDTFKISLIFLEKHKYNIIIYTEIVN